MTVFLVVLAVVVLTVLAWLVLSGSLTTARADAKRRQVFAEQAQAEARIQMRTHAALNELYEASRQRFDGS